MCDRVLPDVILDPGTNDRHGRDGLWCDPCLEPLVRALNDGGLRTVASCCGHGKESGNVALLDGRVLLIVPDFGTARSLDHYLAAWLADRADEEDPQTPTEQGETP